MFFKKGLEGDSNQSATTKSRIKTDAPDDGISGRIISISEADYMAILRWDDEGGQPVNITYQVFKDDACPVV